MKYRPRFFTPPDDHYFLFGARGVGKSTFLGQHYRNAAIIDLLDRATLMEVRSNPRFLHEAVTGRPKMRTWVLDEVQRFPEILTAVHGLIEAHPQLRFVLTGSSARKLKVNAADMLGGRAHDLRIFPYMAAELGSEFSLETALGVGMLPVIWESSEPNRRLKAYVSLYLELEVEMEHLVRDITHFSEFLQIAAFSHGTQVNYAAIAREVGVSNHTVATYFDLIEDLLLGFRLNVFSRRAKRQLVKAKKFYYIDPGLYQTLRPRGPLDTHQEIGGAALEGLVAQHLRSWAHYRGDEEQLFYWRSRGGCEVDFVVYGRDTFTAIEVKSSGTVRHADLAGLMEFHHDYPQATLILLTGYLRPIRKGPVICLPIDVFLQHLTPTMTFAEIVAASTE